ncbi:AAA-like domain-containing protein [Argonema antarcticum]|uniref:AAA-like domain-containing protein n=1 Tax=Argonema antarcticum TaxID=2942763 RepID=UPI0020136074|nr:AAA-like domain-containing protein [Argonema antarcticum]MCL1470353.1 AAA-like domain-containing protein [Argonema antarcticum A004/B2]
MDLKETLEFVDNLIYTKTGKYLSDLEREVFIGSWQGQTYEKIYPFNPEYVEKSVGYKLWQKLSNVLGEKVSKKKFRGALERAVERQSFNPPIPPGKALDPPYQREQEVSERVFISYRSQELDFSLAGQFYEAISAAGHKAFMANVAAIPPHHQNPNSDWLSQIDLELEQCNYFLLLLSPEAAVSEMVIEELRRIKELHDTRQDAKPIVLQLRIDCPPNLQLNHDLRSYLRGTRKRDWFSPDDTPIIVQEILNLLANNGEWGVEISEESETEIVEMFNETSLQSKIQNPKSKIPSPLPVAEPELPSGQVRLHSAFYVERLTHETQCYRAILQPGALIRIKAPRQMGKTSLMARILYQAKEQGYRTVPLSFQHADTAVFTNLNELLRWFCTKISRKLRLPGQVDDYWTDTYGSKDNCTVYFEDCILPEIDSPLVLGLDEVDRVFQYPHIADDFFGLLRAWYEEAGYSDTDSVLWEKLRLVVVHSTEVYIPLNVNQSPFNVGLPIELSEFSGQQVSDLAIRHGLNWQATQVEELMSIVGGHPYLVRVALYHIAQQQLTLEELAEIAPTEAGIYGDHLRRHLWNLQKYPDLAAAFTKVVTASQPVELESVLAFKLHSLGLVQLRGNEVTPRFELYRQYFGDRLSIKN